MKGHKTSGDWSDVTSYGRNEIVFEGRHKEYGAYAVRQRYNGALLLGLLISISTGVVCAGVPFIINLIHDHNQPVASRNVATKIVDVVIPYNSIKPKQKVQARTKTTTTTESKNNNTTKKAASFIITKDDKKDSDLTNKKQNKTDIGIQTVNVGHTGTETTGTGGTDKKDVPDLVQVATNMPKFKGDLYGYIQKHLSYSDEAIETHAEGTTYVSFIIETDGSVSTVKVLRGVAGAPALDDEAVRVIKELPAWTPGSQNGHPVRVQYTIPIKFQLK